MPTLDWLRKEFHYGYQSGSVLSIIPSKRRREEERIIGGSYKNVFVRGVLPYLKPNSKVMELGPGAGSWTRAILKYIPNGKITTLDFQDVRPWLKLEKYNNRLECIHINENSFSVVPVNSFDLFWSFGVLCHNNVSNIMEILQNSLSKMKSGGYAIHQYGDWDKLEKWGWVKGKIPIEFSNMSDNEIWWPRNNQRIMCDIATKTGWEIITPDMGLVERDSIIVLRAK